MFDNKFTRIVISVGLIYALFLFVLFVFQRSFIFHPTVTGYYDDSALKGYDAELIENDNGGFSFLLRSDHQKNKILIFFHGNAGMALHRFPKANVWRQAGFDVFVVEYPGYGANMGSRSEQSFYMAGRAAIKKAQNIFQKSDLYIYGESIGSGTAVQMAAEYEEKALIIEAGFSSLGDVAFSKLPVVPVRFLLKDKFDNIYKINEIDSKLLLIHGGDDKVVPMKFGKKLFDAYTGEKDMLEIQDAGHNDIYLKANMVDIIEGMN